MRSTSIQRSGFKKAEKRKPVNKTTAYYLFNPDYKVVFTMDNVAFRARNNMLNLPIVGDGSSTDFDRMAGEMIHTAGTIMEIVDLFIDGATIAFPDPRTAADCYRRIVDHLDYHLVAMRTQLTYVPPDPQDFKNMSEFATVIRPWAKAFDTNIDNPTHSSSMRMALPVRPSFSYSMLKTEEVSETAAPEVPRSMTRMDSIERMLEKLEHGSRS